MECEIDRWRCATEDESFVTVIAYQYMATPASGEPARYYPGARRLTLSTGEAVRYIDANTVEVIETGELLCRVA